MEKLDKNSWLKEGIKILNAEGFSRITIDNLCERQKRSKGSFYFHFKNIDGYIETLMKYWLEKNTVDFIKITDTVGNMEEKFINLTDLASSVSQKTEQVIRAWSSSNDIVRMYMQQIDNMRMAYLIDLNTRIGMDKKEARNYALLEYGVMIGIQQLTPDISQEDFKYIYDIFSDKKRQRIRNMKDTKTER